MNFDNYEAGEEYKEPITLSQRKYIQQLVYNSALDDHKKEWYLMQADCNISYNEAEGVIEELKKVQIDTVGLARDGRLKESALKVANWLWSNRRNT